MSNENNRIEELESKIEELEKRIKELNISGEPAPAKEAEKVQQIEESDEVAPAETEEVEFDEQEAMPKDAKVINPFVEMHKSEEVPQKETHQKEKPQKATNTKGSQAALFSSDTVTAFSAVANTEEVEYIHRRFVGLKMALVMGILTVISVALRLLSFNVPFLPSFLNIDFSALPEVIASIAYGPVFGIIIVVVKNLIYIGIKIKSLSIPAVVTNVVLNSVFVFITGVYYSRRMFPFDPEFQPERDLRRLYILRGGTLASGVAAVGSFFLAKYVTYPITFKYYTVYSKEHIIYLYQAALDTVNNILPGRLQDIVTTVGSLDKGIALFNVPHTFFKYFVSTILAMLIYNFISPVLHFRTAMMPEEQEKNLEVQQTEE